MPGAGLRLEQTLVWKRDSTPAHVQEGRRCGCWDQQARGTGAGLHPAPSCSQPAPGESPLGAGWLPGVPGLRGSAGLSDVPKVSPKPKQVAAASTESQVAAWQWGKHLHSTSLQAVKKNSLKKINGLGARSRVGKQYLNRFFFSKGLEVMVAGI